MPVMGTLTSMPMQEILRWLTSTAKSGLLTVQHGRVTKCVEFSTGQIVSSSSDAPSNRLGQCLLAHGKISQEQLRSALAVHEQTKDRLGQILVQQKVITGEELERFLKMKARETILSLFDFTEATFQFQEGKDAGPFAVPVGFEMESLLSEGAVRRREMAKFQEVFSSPGMVLRRSGKEVPSDLKQNKMAWSIYQSVDGERTLAELLLHSHASTYLTTKFFYQLKLMHLVEVKEIRELKEVESLPVEEEVALQQVVGGSPLVMMDTVTQETENTIPQPVSISQETNPGVPEDSGAADQIHVAMKFMEQGEYEAALGVLSASQRRYPGNNTVRQLIFETESKLEETVQTNMDMHSIPKLKKSLEEIQQMRLPTGAAYLPTLIDGHSDVRSILWLAPMRTVEALCSLKRLQDMDLIEFIPAN